MLILRNIVQYFGKPIKKDVLISELKNLDLKIALLRSINDFKQEVSMSHQFFVEIYKKEIPKNSSGFLIRDAKYLQVTQRSVVHFSSRYGVISLKRIVIYGRLA